MTWKDPTYRLFGDIAGNVVYAFLSSFVMIFLSDTVGLNTGIVGTLIMVSKLFDGITDILFGALIDKAKTRMGKARSWTFWAFLKVEQANAKLLEEKVL